MGNKKNETRKRAPRMSGEQRKGMIVQATLPLLEKYGSKVTTLQIAEAAGISEPAIYRAFADKNEVIRACLKEATNPNNVIQELQTIKEHEIDKCLLAIMNSLQSYGKRSSTMIAMLRTTSPALLNDQDSITEERKQQLHKGRMTSLEGIREAVARVLETNEVNLRISIEEATSFILTIGLSTRLGDRENQLSIEKLVNYMLYGIFQLKE